MKSDDGATRAEVAGRPAIALQSGSVFGSVETASSFFERGSLGYSDTTDPSKYDGLELRTDHLEVTPLEVDHVFSSFFEDRTTTDLERNVAPAAQYPPSAVRPVTSSTELLVPMRSAPASRSS